MNIILQAQKKLQKGKYVQMITNHFHSHFCFYRHLQLEYVHKNKYFCNLQNLQTQQNIFF